MQQHAQVGYEMLRSSDKPLLQLGAQIARDHHEHWDGNGYPRGLKGERIHIFSRITAIADVYDALRSKLYHKEAWPLEKVLEVFKGEKGKHNEGI